MLVENSASTRGANVPESASESSYPSTGIPGLPDEFEQTVVPNTIEVILPIVSSPTASPTIESAEPEAASLPPADQLMTLPAPSERTPAAQPSPDLITEPQGSPAAVSTAQPVRSEQLESIAREADRKILHGYELAGRGAYFAARSELIAALRLVAQGLDTERQTTIHGKSLAAGLTALREAEDFLPRGSMVEANLDIAALATSHSTPALKNADNSHTTSLSALKSYLTYAQSEFAAAAGGEIAGSMALRALGKLHDELAKKQTTEVQAAGPKAIVFYQAALLVSPENYLAANDLGVLLARAGNLNDARRILESNAANSRQSTVLHNLAVVYQKIGRNDLAYQANRQSLIAAQMEQNHRQVKGIAASGGIVEWVHPDTFAQTSPNLDSPQSVASKQTTPSQTTGVARPQSATSSTNPFGGNNPHWAPNYQKPAIVGKTTSIDYQR